MKKIFNIFIVCFCLLGVFNLALAASDEKSVNAEQKETEVQESGVPLKEKELMANEEGQDTEMQTLTQEAIDDVSYHFDKLPEPTNYDIRKRGFPKGQDVFLIKGKSMSEIWIKAKGWVKSVSLMAEVNGQLIPLKALDDFNFQLDNGLFINGNLQSSNFVATSARTSVRSTGTVLRLFLPPVVAYGDNVNRSANIVTSFDRLFLRLYSEPYGRGLYKDVEYFLKDKLNLSQQDAQSLKRVRMNKQPHQDIVTYEYRSNSLNVNALKLFEDEKLVLSITPKDLVNHSTGAIVGDGIKLTKWFFDPETFQSVMVFDVYLIRKQDRRFVQTTVVSDLEGSTPQSANYTVGKRADSQANTSTGVSIVPKG